jgi:integrase
MSVYSKKGKGWRYDFTIRGQRYTEAWFKTKREAIKAENEKRKEIEQPQETQTDMDFLELVNRRLDHVSAYNSTQHYVEHVGRAKRWIKLWGSLSCGEITRADIEGFVLKRSKVSAHAVNKELRRLRATFNFGKKRGWLQTNPTDGIGFLPEEKTIKFIPTVKQIETVIAVADADTQDYLWSIRDTMARVGEINRLKWTDVDLERRCVVLSTRKKRGGHLTPRRVPMTERLYRIMLRRYRERDPQKPWVFWHTYRSTKTGEECVGPYKDRKRLMSGPAKRLAFRIFASML